jgi:serine/threonine-protein kinase
MIASFMSAPVQEGDVIRQKYRVDHVLGEGGMGVVVAAWHLRLEQHVAIKFLRPAMLAHPQVVERFLREARAASKIESDHVARVLDVDTLDDGTPFMVMEHLDGSDLSHVRREGAPLPVDEAVRYVLEACEAIAEAHGAGIVHRDLKPANLFLARRRDGRTRIKVLDFGISKLQSRPGASDVGMTHESQVMGSIEYMSPEQMLSSRDVDARTDIWAIGVVLYELCTGRVPFPGNTLTEVCALVMSRQPPPPSLYRPDLPPALEAVILRCLVKDRGQRLETIGALVEALQPFASPPRAPLPEPVTEPFPEPVPDAVTLVLGVTPVRSESSTTALTSDPVPAPPVRSLRPIAIGGLALLGAGALAAVMMLGRASPAGDGATSTTPMATAAAPPAPASSPAAVDTAPVVSPAAADPSPSASAPPTAAPIAKRPASVSPAPAKAAPPVAPSVKPTASAKPASGKRPQID